MKPDYSVLLEVKASLEHGVYAKKKSPRFCFPDQTVLNGVLNGALGDLGCYVLGKILCLGR